ncbi:ATP-grasp domain-containing protein [Lysinibacillus endophyticus]|uniref:ATP-grasp domain-containing protein n=1 Tax=Ureibacillus endophyticus TaxID=1978490 RepID=UPI003136B0E8
MKKVIILGGSRYQVPIIKKAREMGLYIVICDILEDCPGKEYAHEFFAISTAEKESILNLAESLNVDGIIAYASDLNALTAAYVSEKLNLPSNPYRSVEILSNKEKFRKFLKENNFNTPRAKAYDKFEDALKDIQQFKLPVMIKPVDSSGSKGVSKIDSIELLQEKVEIALNSSRVKRFIIEEFIESKYYHVGGEGFSVNGKLVYRCFVNEHFPQNAYLNQFVPIGSTYPCILPNRIQGKIHNEIQKVLDLLNMKTGAYNFDIRLDDNENIYLIEIAARNGGGELQNIVKYATEFMLNENIINAALGNECNTSSYNLNENWACYYLYCNKTGIFKTIEINNEFKENNIVEYNIFVKAGDKISALTGAHNIIGTMVLRFSSTEEMLNKIENIDDYVQVIIN